MAGMTGSVCDFGAPVNGPLAQIPRYPPFLDPSVHAVVIEKLPIFLVGLLNMPL